MPHSASEDDVARLLGFLRDRDAACPICGYNLRNLTKPTCPECKHDLLLTVGATNPRFLWFLIAIAPSMFSGTAAAILLIPMTMQMVMGGGVPQVPVFVLDALGWTSLLGGIVLFRHRFAFLRQKLSKQRSLAFIAWLLHVMAFLGFLATILIIEGGP